MTGALDQLIALLSLQRLQDGSCRGASLDIGTRRVYGGQVLAQALTAAQQTIPDNRTIHSLHAYFLREGDHRVPIDYRIEITRDGRSFSTRQVTAIQNDQTIFIAQASFHLLEPGLEYQLAMPDLASSLPWDDVAASGRPAASLLARLIAPFDIRPARLSSGGPHHGVWFKTTHALSDDGNLQRAILAYVSDYGLVRSLLIPHGLQMENAPLRLASIDHGMWFHRPFRIDDWMLYLCKPLTTSNARGLARGSIYSRDGTLVASTMQEGLLRQI